jgi:hypothetical protein
MSSTLRIDVAAIGISAADFQVELEKSAAELPPGTQFSIPKPTLGNLGLVDPSLLQIGLVAVGSGGALAIGLKGLFQVLNTYGKNHGAPLKVKIGANTLELPGNLPDAERIRLCDQFISRVSQRPVSGVARRQK